MNSGKLITKIRSYSIIAFLIPLIAINLCLLVYKFIGSTKLYPNLNWDKETIELSFNKFSKSISNADYTWSYTNCPSNIYRGYHITTDNRTIEANGGYLFFLWDDINFTTNYYNKDTKFLIRKLIKEKKIKSFIMKKEEIPNKACVKNHKISYFLLTKFNSLEELLIKGKFTNTKGYVKIKNPYLYGEVSISRTARYFPSVFIFKSLIILSAFILFLYWKNNLKLFDELKNKNILTNFSKKFFYFGVLSSIFLALHAAFLGLKFDLDIFNKGRRLIIILFIFFEIFSQFLLTKNLFKFKANLKQYINPAILKLKVIFVTIVFIITCVAFTILSFGDPSTAFKHTLEWNYFAFLLLYYLMSRLLWKKVQA